MEANFYQAMLRRKSFHLFRNAGAGTLTPEELDGIRAAFAGFEPLVPEIRTAIRIVPASQVSFKHDAEYCILIYSEKKENWLMNAGYLGEQLDLWLVSRSIGTLWFGIGKPDEPGYDGLDYVIMIAVRKISDASQFRQDLSKARRKPLDEIWAGDTLGLAEIVRYAPSAVNSQPWFVKNENGTLTVYRTRKPGRIGIMPEAAASYFNRIDIGIFLCCLEVCLAEKGLPFTRELFPDLADGKTERSKVAVYTLAN